MIYAILDGKYKIDGFDPNEVLSITFSEAEFRNIVTRGGTLSNQVKLAKTGNNQRTLGLLDDVKAKTLQAYKLFEADLYVDSLKVFSGNMQILESNDFYNVRFFSSSAGFFSLIKGRKLNTIDLSAFNHTWSAANVNSRRQATTGVVYPNINYGGFTNTANTSKGQTRFYPSVYINTLFDKIATELGYTFTALSSFTKILPFSKKEFTNNVSIIGATTRTSTQTIGPLTSTFELINFNTIGNDPLSLISNSSGHTVLDVNKGSVKVSGTIFYAADAGNSGDMSFFINVNNQPSQRIGTAEIGVTGSFTYEVTVDTSDFTSFPIEVEVSCGGELTDTLNVLANSTFNLDTGSLDILANDTIAVRDTLPDLTITELFQYIAVTENAIISVDNQAKTIKLDRFKEIVDKYPTANNFSKKVADENNVRTIYHLNEYGQSNNLDYKVPTEDDPTSVPTVNGRGTFTIADTSLDIEKTLYEAPFFRSGLFTGLTDQPLMITIPRYTTTSIDYDKPDINPGVRVLDVVIDTSLLIPIAGVAAVTPQANVTFVDFAQEVTDNYASFSTALNNLKVIEVDLNLTAQDISEVSFNKPVFLLDSYWYVMKIKQFEVNQASPTTFRLLRLF